MSLCDDQLRPVLAALAERYGWACEPLRNDRRVFVTTGRVTADAEPIRLLVRLDEGDALVMSDGGETLGRLFDEAFSRDDPVFESLWRDALKTYHVLEADDRVYLQAPLLQAAQALNRFADALVALDGLRVVAWPPLARTRTLADEVEDFLADRYSRKAVIRAPRIRLPGGLVITPALRVDTGNREGVLVQPGSAAAQTHSFEHAYTTFTLAERGPIPITNRLVVLGGSVERWNANRLRALADVAFIGFWRHREPMERFLDGEIPDDPVMVPSGVDIPLLPLH